MRLKEKKILFLVDNASIYTLYEDIELTNIEIKFLPLNTIMHLQSCDKNIINNFKIINTKKFLM
jgi:hypothetical protein